MLWANPEGPMKARGIIRALMDLPDRKPISNTKIIVKGVSS
jgi:hypothetical protein